MVNDRAQLYQILQPLYCTLKRLGDTPTTTDNCLSPSIKWYRDSNCCLIFKGSCLKQKKNNFTPPNRIKFFVYKLDTWSGDLNSNFTLKDCLFRIVKLAKNFDPAMVLDLIRVQNFHYLTVAWVNYPFWS